MIVGPRHAVALLQGRKMNEMSELLILTISLFSSAATFVLLPKLLNSRDIGCPP